MTIYENMSVVLSTMAIIISALSFIHTKINDNRIKKIYDGQIEMAIRESITAANNRIADILLEKHTQSNQYTDQCMKVATEQLLNSYEEACAKYIDSKIDKKRYKKTYIDEIKNIVESSNLNEYFQFGSKYDAIKKVYDEWFDKRVVINDT